MKRSLFVLSLFFMGDLAYSSNSSLTVSSGTYLAIDGFTTTGSQFRQAITIGDPSVVNNVAPVDAIGGLTVRLATSSASGIGSLSAGTAEIGNIKNSGTFAVQATASQSGTWTVQPGNTANTTAWKVDNSAVTQPVSGTVTVIQGTASNQRASVSIDGSSNTIQGTVTCNQSNPSAQQISASINGSSNTVTVQGPVVSSTTASGNPILLGVVASSAPLNAANNGSIITLKADRYGRLMTLGSPKRITSSGGTAITTAANTLVVSTPTAGNHNRIYYVEASNSGATSTVVSWRDGISSTLRYETFLPQNGVFAHNIDYWDQTSATALYINTTAAGNIYWTIEYEVVAD